MDGVVGEHSQDGLGDFVRMRGATWCGGVAGSRYDESMAAFAVVAGAPQEGGAIVYFGHLRSRRVVLAARRWWFTITVHSVGVGEVSARWIERGEWAMDLGGIEFVVVAKGFVRRVEGLVARHCRSLDRVRSTGWQARWSTNVNAKERQHTWVARVKRERLSSDAWWRKLAL